MAQKTEELQEQLKGEVKSQSTAEQNDKAQYKAYTPQLNKNYEEVTDEQKAAIAKMYEINPDETAVAYFQRTSPRPKEFDEKKAKRARLFAGIGDAAMALADGLTLSKGGLVAPRESAYAKTSKAIEAQRAKAAKDMASYNALYQQALQSDSKTAREARKGRATALQKLADDVRRANREIDASNLKAINDANKTNVATYNKAVAEADRREWLEGVYEKNRENATKNAAIRAAGQRDSNNKDISYLTMPDGATYTIPTPKARQLLGPLQRVASAAIENETNSGNKGIWTSWSLKGALDLEDISAIFANSSYLKTAEGKRMLSDAVGQIEGGRDMNSTSALLSPAMPGLGTTQTQIPE